MRYGTDRAEREVILNQWYRREPKAVLPDLIPKWESVIGVQVAEWGIKKRR